MWLTVDGERFEVSEGRTVLDAIRSVGLDVPTLCSDPRVKPSGACRACLVAVEGVDKLVASCAMPAADGMAIRTSTPELIRARRDVLKMLARDYARKAFDAFPEKEFHRWLRAYGLENCLKGTPPCDRVDDSNPYFTFDPSACIECYRCVQICSDLQGSFVWQILERGGRSRVVPDSLATLAASSCKSCGACVDGCPSGALVDKSRAERGAPDRWTRTTCPYCGVGCELSVGTRDDRIVQVLPVLDAPVSKGHLCVKGRYANSYVYARDRITEPMLRKNGSLTPVAWDEAILFVADSLLRIRERHGPDAIGVLGSARAPNEDNYLAQEFARVIVGTNNVDCCARVCHAPTAAAMKTLLGTGAATNSFDDIERARTLMVAGSNATENHPIIGSRILQAKLSGANLIVIDPREIELARHADVHLQLHPGTNVPLLNAMASVIVEEGIFDREFVETRVEDWEAFREFVSAYRPEAVAEVCGVSAESIREAARIYAGQRPSMCLHGLGMTEHLQGTEGVMCLVNLALITGNLGKPGTGINPLRGQNNVQGAAHMGCEPSNLTGFVSLLDGRERFEGTWSASLPTAPGKNLMAMLDAAESGGLKALWAIGYDVLFTNPSADRTRAALGAMDLVIAQDLFLNETAREFAHAFLPACSSFERGGTFMNAERRVQRVRKAIEPLGNSKPDWEIVQRVARAMGHQQGFDFDSEEEIWEEVRSVWAPGAGMSYQRLEEGGLQWPCPSEDHPGMQILHASRFPVGERAAVRTVPFEPSPESPTDEFPFVLNSGRSLYQFNAGTMTMRTANRTIRPTDTLDMNPADAEGLGLKDGDRVRLVSCYGEAGLPIRRDRAVRHGELFATFHDRGVFLNLVTGGVRDRVTHTPEYKRTAVRVERVEGATR